MMDTVTERVATYLRDNEISVTQTAKDLHIMEDKLLNKSEPLEASEFLALCKYLHIQPEKFQ